MQGYWLLLEDLDYAPMDVISILVPLLETRTLPLPGKVLCFMLQNSKAAGEFLFNGKCREYKEYKHTINRHTIRHHGVSHCWKRVFF